MATKTGVWNLQQVRDKQLQSLWSYSGASTEPGELWAVGPNWYGNLGDNSRTHRSSPVQVPGEWKAVRTSGAHTISLKSDNTLWAMGYNEFGVLGQNNLTNYSSPVQVPGTTWSTLIRGGTHGRWVTGAIKTDGTLWSWGYNVQGQLGQGNTTKYSSPVQIPGTTWSSGVLAAPGSFNAIKTDGTLWTWGDNSDGALGQNNQTDYSSPKQVGSGTDWASAAACAAIKTDGTLWIWGYNAYGEIGNNTASVPGFGQNKYRISSPVQIPGTTWSSCSRASAGYLSYAVKTDGTLWAWGYGADGSLGQNDRISRSSPVQVPGTTWALVDTVDTSTGNYFVRATKTDGTLWGWGGTSQGELGQNESGPGGFYSSPVQIPGAYSTSSTHLGKYAFIKFG